VRDLTKWSQFEPWKRELAELVIKAAREKLYLRSYYQQLTFTPKALAAMLCKDHFVWGVVNWELIKPINNPDFPDPQQEIKIKLNVSCAHKEN